MVRVAARIKAIRKLVATRLTTTTRVDSIRATQIVTNLIGGQMKRDPNAPVYEQGLLLGFSDELEKEYLQYFLDECRQCLALEVAYQVAGEGKDLEKLLAREVTFIRTIAEEEIASPTPPAN